MSLQEALIFIRNSTWSTSRSLIAGQRDGVKERGCEREEVSGRDYLLWLNPGSSSMDPCDCDDASARDILDRLLPSIVTGASNKLKLGKPSGLYSSDIILILLLYYIELSYGISAS